MKNTQGCFIAGRTPFHVFTPVINAAKTIFLKDLLQYKKGFLKETFMRIYWNEQGKSCFSG